jgi:hypothetical protein
VRLVDRNVVDRVLREHAFQAGDWSNQQKTAELGNALNADWIVRGELEAFGDNILVTVQFYDIQTFRFMGGADTLLANAVEAMEKIDPLVNRLVETITAAEASRPAPAPVYTIRSRGPGGGIIFFAESGVYKEFIDIGSLNFNDAMRSAQNYRGGGFSDWRLPTRSELLDMWSMSEHGRPLNGLFTTTYWASEHDVGRRVAGTVGRGFQSNEDFSSIRAVRVVRMFSQ